MNANPQGPLAGVKVIEIAGIGPGPFCAMLLADMGAQVLRIDRADRVDTPQEREARFEIPHRGRPSVAMNLKHPEAVATLRGLLRETDVLIEGFRPGVMERLGLGPEACAEINPRLVYGRMTGWGQSGPLAQRAGHDINYIALTGALHAIGPAEGGPVPPLNLLGDFAGGSLYLAYGIVCALLERQSSGRGQVVDGAIIDGTHSLMAFIHAAHARGDWRTERASNMLDGGRPWYGVYETADGKHVAIGAIERPFYAELLHKLGLDPDTLPGQHDAAGWPELQARLAAVFRTRTRDDWCTLLQDSDACFAPVLDMDEAPQHPHNRARGAFVEVAGVNQPAPAPRLSRTPGAIAGPAAHAGQHTRAALAAWGLDLKAVDALLSSGAAAQSRRP
ncbi:CaiB/BaiF CoA-transferase family protein [uncultured Hydrogenophaga sp.]|uniref:CaiB/BaiF CoA transferase family protein n=1 Tax=uncultured Hydrogenophaga sp. TaxID=199683 RepID=UPI0025838A97|nr:CaiB/BaiF CoA-transferase family protein [uncultured Hydrogenophaga sp.]